MLSRPLARLWDTIEQRCGGRKSQRRIKADDRKPNGLSVFVHQLWNQKGLTRLPHVGGGGSAIRRSPGFAARSRIASWTERSSCGSRPAITSFGQFSTSTSGATPSFSTAHLLSRAKNPNRGAIIDPPSTNGGVSLVATRPPHVRLPTSGPILRRLNMYGMRSPPEPAISLMIMTFGPQMPDAGLVNGTRLPAGLLKYPS